MDTSNLRGKGWRRSFSLVELLASSVILSLLAVSAIPFAETQRSRRDEIELRDSLMKMRIAMHAYAYNELYSKAQHPTSLDGDLVRGEDPLGDPDGDGMLDDDLDGLVDEDGAPYYPPTMDDLVAKKYLSSVPRDPLSLVKTAPVTWTVLSVTREHKVLDRASNPPTVKVVTTKGLYDVRSKSKDESLQGTRYDGW